MKERIMWICDITEGRLGISAFGLKIGFRVY